MTSIAQDDAPPPETSLAAAEALRAGCSLLEKGDLQEAERFLSQAVRLAPSSPAAHAGLGRLLQRTRRPALAEKAYRHALQLRPDYAHAWGELGNLFKEHRRVKEAVDCFRRATSLDSAVRAPWIGLLQVLEWANRHDEVEAVLAAAKKALPPSAPLLVAEARFLRHRSKAAEAISLLEGFLDTCETSPQNADLFFELGDLYDLVDVPDKAFGSFARAHGCRLTGAAYNNDQFSGVIARLRTGFTPAMCGEDSEQRQPSSLSPVFLVGFPRSGTTLLDQILSSHPDVGVAEEIRAVNKMVQHLASGGYPESLERLRERDILELREIYFSEHRKYMDIGSRKIFVDKMPLNLVHAGLIRRVFPGARFILALRHPCDAVLSCFMRKFSLRGATVLGDLAQSYSEIFDLWQHYRDILDLTVHEVRYEDVVADFRATVSGLLDFLGLEWNDAVLEFDKTARAKGHIFTPSYHQVTQKIYTRASGRWLRYRQHLEPVLPVLAPWAHRYGYAMDGQEPEKE